MLAAMMLRDDLVVVVAVAVVTSRERAAVISVGRPVSVHVVVVGWTCVRSTLAACLDRYMLCAENEEQACKRGSSAHTISIKAFRVVPSPGPPPRTVRRHNAGVHVALFSRCAGNAHTHTQPCNNTRLKHTAFSAGQRGCTPHTCSTAPATA